MISSNQQDSDDEDDTDTHKIVAATVVKSKRKTKNTSKKSVKKTDEEYSDLESEQENLVMKKPYDNPKNKGKVHPDDVEKVKKLLKKYRS